MSEKNNYIRCRTYGREHMVQRKNSERMVNAANECNRLAERIKELEKGIEAIHKLQKIQDKAHKELIEERKKLQAKLDAAVRIANSLGWNPNDGQKTAADTAEERIKRRLLKALQEQENA